MNHLGSPEQVKTPWEPPNPLRTFEVAVLDRDGCVGYRTVEAHKIVFTDRFVQWWEDRAPDVPDFLVWAVHVADVLGVEERRWVPVPVEESVPVRRLHDDDEVADDGPVVRRPFEVAEDLLALTDLDG